MAPKKQRQLRLFPIGQFVDCEGQSDFHSEYLEEPDVGEWESIMEDLARLLAAGPFQVSKGEPDRGDREKFRGA